jgi:hypothetical protein
MDPSYVSAPPGKLLQNSVVSAMKATKSSYISGDSWPLKFRSLRIAAATWHENVESINSNGACTFHHPQSFSLSGFELSI